MSIPKKCALNKRLSEYIESCHCADKKHPFPNIAGFCRFIGVSIDELLCLKSERPEDFGDIMLGLEDAALNSGATASLINLYLKQYGFWQAPASDDIECDHDMLADGI